jgi:hypothetical protein
MSNRNEVKARADDVRRTYNYLRLSMIAVLLAIFVAVAGERLVGRCFQESISAYYYTPVQAVFVGGLLALGVGMVAIWGRTDVEDAFLNLAGLFAPVVAFVPTTVVNRCSVVDVDAGGTPLDRGSIDQVTREQPKFADGAQAAIDNNILAFLVVVFFALLIMAIVRRVRPARHRPGSGQRLPYQLSYGLAVLAWGVGVVTFTLMREGFYDRAHGWSAILLFVCIIVVVFAGAQDRAKAKAGEERWKDLSWIPRTKLVLKDKYAWLGLAMIGSVGAIAIYEWATGWAYWVLLVETVLLVQFAVFWVMQTVDYWWNVDEESEARPSPSGKAEREPVAES